MNNRTNQIKCLAFTLTMVFVLGGMTVLAKKPDIPHANALRSIATPVELTADDVSIVSFGDFYYVAIDHNLGDQCDHYVWFEPARLGGHFEIYELGVFNTLYLGVAGQEGGEVHHKGQVSVYYEILDDEGEFLEWQSIIAQFNGEGELLHVNGVIPE